MNKALRNVYTAGFSLQRCKQAHHNSAIADVNEVGSPPLLSHKILAE